LRQPSHEDRERDVHADDDPGELQGCSRPADQRQRRKLFYRFQKLPGHRPPHSYHLADHVGREPSAQSIGVIEFQAYSSGTTTGTLAEFRNELRGGTPGAGQRATLNTTVWDPQVAVAAAGVAAISAPIGSWLAPGFTFTTSAALGIGNLRVAPIYIARAATIAGITDEATALSTEAGVLYRVGIYADRGDGVPGALLVDGGTIPFGSADTIGQFTKTISAAVLTPGWYFVGGVVQAASASQPTIRVVSTGTVVSAIGAGSLTTSPAIGYQVTGVTAGLPTPFAATPSVSSIAPRCAIQLN
jgi:hypothetical protein